MSKKKDETFVEYKSRVLDPISKSYCAAKWYNATIWLQGGKTTSCHNPLPHSINAKELEGNPSALHNTFEKKAERTLMMKGLRPRGCSTCWVVENLNDPTIISDRVYKSEIYCDEDIEFSHRSSRPSDHFVPRNLEVSFNSNCNLACSYCNSSFSSRWSDDIARNGHYENLIHEDKLKINHLGEDYQSYKDDEENNPFLKAFWEWWPELIENMSEFRITGGEPLLSPDVWKVLDQFIDKKLDHINLAINSNLCAGDKVIERLIEKSKDIKSFDLYTSCEAVDDQAEYIRDGLDYKRFIGNCEKVIQQGNFSSLNMMMTINGLSLYSIPEFLDEMVALKEKYGMRFPVWTMNIIKYPAFMSPLALPENLREERACALESWLKKNKSNKIITDMELEHVHRLIEFLKGVPVKDREILEKDFKSFYTQYDNRRSKSFENTFPAQIVEWYKNI